MTNEPVPKIVRQVLSTDYTNGFGFQFEGDKDGYLIIAQIQKIDGYRADVKATETYLRAKTQSKTVEVFDWLGRVWVELHWTEWSAIPLVFQALIDKGCLRVRAHTNGDAQFEPGETFSLRTVEEKQIAGLFESRSHVERWSQVWDVDRKPHVYLQYHNWKTPAGKTLCAAMRAELLPNKPYHPIDAYPVWREFDETARRYRLLWHGGWSAYAPSGSTADDLIALPMSRQRAAEELVDIAIALAPLALPAYVLLWISDWEEPARAVLSEAARVGLLQSVVDAVRRVIAEREKRRVVGK